MRYHKHFIEEVWSIHTYIRCCYLFQKNKKCVVVLRCLFYATHYRRQTHEKKTFNNTALLLYSANKSKQNTKNNNNNNALFLWTTTTTLTTRACLLLGFCDGVPLCSCVLFSRQHQKRIISAFFTPKTNVLCRVCCCVILKDDETMMNRQQQRRIVATAAVTCFLLCLAASVAILLREFQSDADAVQRTPMYQHPHAHDGSLLDRLEDVEETVYKRLDPYLRDDTGVIGSLRKPIDLPHFHHRWQKREQHPYHRGGER